MSSHDFVLFALQIALMLAFGLFFGQLLRRRRQLAVVGEMLAGILLGPTVVGALFPGFYAWLFLSSEQVAAARCSSAWSARSCRLRLASGWSTPCQPPSGDRPPPPSCFRLPYSSA